MTPRLIYIRTWLETKRIISRKVKYAITSANSNRKRFQPNFQMLVVLIRISNEVLN